MPSCRLQTVKGITVKDMQSISSYMCSLRYIKKMVPLLVYNIVYHRIDFDASFFVNNKVSGISFKTFKSKTKDHPLAEVFYWCKGVAEAIEKKYLKEMHLIFRDKTKDVICEDYKFSFKYDDEPNPASLPKSADVIKMTKKLFESIQELGKFEKLNDEIGISLEMVFFDGAAPEKYDPPYFAHPVTTPLILREGSKFHTISYLKTGFHELKCAVRNPMQLDDDATETGIENDNVNEKQVLKESNIEDVEIDIEKDTTINHPVKMWAPDDLISIASSTIDPTEFHCPCGMNYQINSVDKVKCSICSTFQHVECAGFMNRSGLRRQYICIYCNTDENISSDKYLQSCKPEDWKMTCSLRLILNYVHKCHEIPVDLLQLLDLDTRKLILKWLKKFKIMTFNIENNSVKVSNDFTVVMSQFFSDIQLPNSMLLDENTENIIDIM